MNSHLTFIIEQLSPIITPYGNISQRKMFGEHCLFLNGTMFAIITQNGQLFIKVDKILATDTPFSYQKQGKSVSMRYVLIDDAWLDEPEILQNFIQQRW